ncbi:MAG: enoyl-CoA hydratase/isomerase family protein [Deltaproteobacteria bacterium]|nr:MAG: enoyl-CoA hydratase/isomerase family protein [Deltaproteobacteria bacterium]RLC21447.1 MAG: enoyl-CoA hydratase/isomerase family protein [Deltaproteobacteria bacterium]
MAFEKIVVETGENHVATLSLNRPESMNTFSSQMAAELNQALLELDSDALVRVILLKGEGKAFCAGIDVNELAGKTAIEYREWIEKMETPLVTISKLKTPVIAQLHGVAAANGMGLIAAADLVIAADTSRMGLTAINVGLNCVGPVIPVARCVGRKKALELLLYGNLIKMPEALSLGLINKIVPQDELESQALQWAEELAQKSPIAVQIAKTGFYHSEDMNYEDQFAYMNEAFARLCTTDDAKEGVTAFFERRNPVWQEK